MKEPKSTQPKVDAPAKERKIRKPNGAPDLSVMLAWMQAAKTMARKKHWEYFVIDQFLRGNQTIKGNPNDNSIEVSRGGENISFPINKIFTTFRAVRGFVTRHKPVVEVDPDNQSEEAKTNARRTNRVLERDNQLNNFRKINKEWVYFGIKYGLGYRQIGYDPVEKKAIRWTVDPWDLWLGSTDGEMEDSPYLIKTVKRTMGYLWDKFPKYKDSLAPDNELAADEYKKLSLQITNQNEGQEASVRQDEQTKIVYECWYRVFTVNKNGGMINKCTFVDECILDFEETPYNEYPFIAYKSDIVPNEATGEGHLKHVIAPQRMLNMLNMQVLAYNHVVNTGRFITEKDSGIAVINTKIGQIIRVNKGKRLEAAPIPPINPLMEYQIDKAEAYIQDIGGQQDASMGRLPSAGLSGDAIEALQIGDSNNISDLRDNFEDSLELEAAWILYVYSLFESDGFTVSQELKEGGSETYGVVGQKAIEATNKIMPKNPETQTESYMDNGDYVDVLKILPKNQVKVSIQSELGETKEARINLLLQLLKAGVPLQTVLSLLEFPNTSDVMERIASEQIADVAMEGMKNQMNQPTPINGEAVPSEANLGPQLEGLVNGQ